MNKKIENNRLREKYPLFEVPSSLYYVKFINKYSRTEELILLLGQVQKCTNFTVDTENEESSGKLALIQVQTIPCQPPILMILIELAHLPSTVHLEYVLIKELFTLIFRLGNRIFSWGDLTRELRPTIDYQLLMWPIMASTINLQLYFSEWYTWALTRCELCCLRTYEDVKCHEPNPYKPGELWALQKAMAYAAQLFIDKSYTCSNWRAGLTANNSTLPDKRRNAMIRYALYDCFSTTYLTKPLLLQWTFDKLKNTSIIELFTSFETVSIPKNSISQKINKNKDIKNINVQKLATILMNNESDLEDISSDEEIYQSQFMEPVMITKVQVKDDGINQGPDTVNNDEEITNVNDTQVMEYDVESTEIHGFEPISESELAVNQDNEGTEQVKIHSRKQLSTSQRRSTVARKQRNRQHNKQRRKYRFKYSIERKYYYRFTIHQMKEVLRFYNIIFTHVKPDDTGDSLIIGLSNEQRREEAEQQLAINIFNRRAYYHYRKQYHRYRK